MTRCEKCGDMPNIIFWLRKSTDGFYHATLEKSTTAAVSGHQIVHRPGFCDGNLEIYDTLPGRTILDG